jgi:valyl-tRNA synthetase
MMPFITEELWQRLGERKGSIALAAFPVFDSALIDEGAEREIGRLQEIIGNIRNMRAEMRVDAKRKIPVDLHPVAEGVARLSAAYRQAIERFGSLSALHIVVDPLTSEGGVVRALPEFSLKISHKDAVDLEAERSRLVREKEKLEKDIASLSGQLANEQFLAKAPPAVVQNMRQRMEDLSSQHRKVVETLEKLG